MLRLLVLWCALGAANVAHAATVVTKTADDFTQVWTASPWAPASATVAVLPQPTGSTVRAEIAFAGTGFQWWGMSPSTPVVIPGRAQNLTLRVKGTKGYPIVVTLRDGWGREKDEHGEFKWTFVATGEWQDATVSIPPSRVFPITVASIGTHNWHQQKSPETVEIVVDALGATTDIADVDPATGALAGWTGDPANDKATEPRVPLVSASLGSSAVSHVFTANPPRFNLGVRSWQPGTVQGNVRWSVTDWQGAAIVDGAAPLSIDSSMQLDVAPALPGFGAYAITVTIDVAGTQVFSDTAAFAHLPEPITLTADEHATSPYGLNVHGGRHVLVEPFAAAGIRWYRDYAFSFDWLEKSKGADRSFTGWPNHRAIVDAYLSRGLGLLPCMMKTIRGPSRLDGEQTVPPPDAAWKRHLFEVFAAFPEIHYWEVDNEYDLHDGNAAYESGIGWANYRAYHRAFAEVLHLVDDQKVAVENGRAGMWPDLAQECIDSGDFAGIGVINIHHYCGVDAPEINTGNKNTNFGDAFDNRQRPMLFADRMREVVRVASSDDRERKVWLTEFGWDDLAGPKVTTERKAAYLVRGWLATLQAGVEKSFWFFDLSTSPEKAANFFDGCGLLDHRQQPVAALATLAGLTQALPAPRWLGTLRIGDTIQGAVLMSRGQRVAVLWTVDGSPATIALKAERFTDAFANPLPPGPLALGDLPVYAIGVADDEPLLRQTAYDVTSLSFLQAAAGDTVTVAITITNDRTTPMSGRLSVAAPAGWEVGAADLAYTVAVGESAVIEVPVRIAADETLGEHRMVVTAHEGDDAVKAMAIRVLAVAPVTLSVAALTGEPGVTTLSVRVLNQSVRTQDAHLEVRLPASWSTPNTRIPVLGLASEEIRTIEIPLTWGIAIAPGEEAHLSVVCAGSPPVQRPIIPSHSGVPRIEGLTIDGDLADWPVTARMPSWMLGWKGLTADADLFVGWSPDGLMVAADVRDSALRVTSPRTFWEGDVLEVFLATGDNLAPRSWRADDHQFWLTPLLAENRAFLGRWPRGEKNPPTQYDIPGLRSAVVRTSTGYRLEAIIPAAAIAGWKPEIGRQIGLVLSLTIHGSNGKREVFWPRSKDDGTPWQPGLWGRGHLGE